MMPKSLHESVKYDANESKCDLSGVAYLSMSVPESNSWLSSDCSAISTANGSVTIRIIG